VKAIIGTAGHIDHGKTALVRALTGIDTDRLPEEQRRGISIELGFAWMDTPAGDRVGIVDVPGHERFVRQMLAGAQGFDLLMLVIAADDGVMPQTEEHFEICHLLDVKTGLFVITKADLASETRIAEVREEIAILAAGTPFEDAPILVTSAQTGAGIEDLRARVLASVAAVERGTDRGSFRMPVDRAFVVKGHGVVVTGTAAGGNVKVGDDVVIAPRGLAARVREVQVHEVSVESAAAGQRIALNLGGVDRDDVSRGDTVVVSGTDAVTDRFDAHVEVRPSARRPLRSHERVRVYLGTREVPGRVVWLDREAVEPRSRAYGQIVLREPGVTFSGERFVLRDETAERTLGGGTVLIVHARRHPRAERADVVSSLATLERGDAAGRLASLLKMTAGLGVSPQQVGAELNAPPSEFETLARGSATVEVLTDGSGAKWLVTRERFDRYVAQLDAHVRGYHASQPSRPGIELEQLRHDVDASVEPRLFRCIVESLVRQKRMVRRGNFVALPEHRVMLPGGGEADAQRVLETVRGAGVMPPTLKQLQDDLGLSASRVAEIVGVLQERRDLVKISADLVFSRDVLADVAGRLAAQLRNAPEITAAEFRDLIGASRKYSIPLLDYFDRTGLTVRSGDARRLRGK